MQLSKFTVIILSIFLISACTASKRSTKTTVVAPAPQTPTTNVPANVQTTPKTSTQIIASTPSPLSSPASPFTSSFMTKPSNGIYAPKQAELLAIQKQFPAVTMAQLEKGYNIYAEGACTNCHKAKNIYQFDETEWKGIIDNMAREARISEAEKDAVYKYVLSIKATQAK